MKTTRRGLFGLFAGLGAASLAPEVKAVAPLDVVEVSGIEVLGPEETEFWREYIREGRPLFADGDLIHDGVVIREFPEFDAGRFQGS